MSTAAEAVRPVARPVSLSRRLRKNPLGRFFVRIPF